MRIVLDLQACQTENSAHGIGRHTLSFTQALARATGNQDLRIVLNGRLGDTIMPIRHALDSALPQAHINIFNVPGADTGSVWSTRAAERIREQYLTTLMPDIVHVSSLFEGFSNDAVTSIGELASAFDTTVALHDLIRLPAEGNSTDAAARREWYYRKLQSLKKADLILATSEHVRQQALASLQLSSDQIISISSAVDPVFRVSSPSVEAMVRLAGQFTLTRPFVLSTGSLAEGHGADTVIEAFALLPATVRLQHQLVLAGPGTADERTRLTTLAMRFGMATDHVVLTGPVLEADLVALYNTCVVQIASESAGRFDQSWLEAMSCGAAVIAAEGSTLATTGGLRDALFSENAEGMSVKLFHVLTDGAFRTALRDHAALQASQFSWGETARIALSAYEHLYQRRQEAQRAAIAVSLKHPKSVNGKRPRLAFVSPLPAEQTGIADYSAILLPELAQYYQIDVVVEQEVIATPWISSNFPARSIAWFDANAAQYDRIIYHFGNSNFHVHMFELLERHPGVVVLHDFFLSGARSNVALKQRIPDAFLRALYESHGYRALLDLKRDGEDSAVWKYPCNKQVLEQATGIIVHSGYSKQLADDWYGPGTAALWQTIPLLRIAPATLDRNASRSLAGLPESAFVICSFGMLGPTKLNALLLDAWLDSPLAQDERCFLVFVGENDPNDYGANMLAKAAASGAADRIQITGFASPQLYQSYLGSADVAVQLRARSRGETSASILDCLAYGIPTIVNANGSAAELPDDVVIRLADEVSLDELNAALVLLRNDAALRQRLSSNATTLITTSHHPTQAGHAYHDAIEYFALHGPHAGYTRLIGSLAALPAAGDAPLQDQMDTATAIAANQPGSTPHQLLVDISAMVQVDIKTGIQRVVRSVLNVLLNEAPEGFRVEPVYDAGGYYAYARGYTLDMIGMPELTLEDSAVEFHAGDIFLGLDLYMHGTVLNEPVLANMRNCGVRIYFVIYDLLPLLRPDVFPADTETYFHRWLSCIAGLSDGLICISRSVADELALWLASEKTTRHGHGTPGIGYFHLGADILASLPTAGLSHDADDELALIGAHPSLLMVGTVEPRKGHVQALDAFDILWAQGMLINLVIVGNEGWMVEKLVTRLLEHPQRGIHLFWMKGISDEMLMRLYENTSALLAASEGEGFGLPLIEAAQHELPIIARGLPVFREVAGKHAFFFDTTTPQGLADALRDWLALHANDRAPDSAGMPWLTWRESTQQLVTTIQERSWYRTLT